MSTGWNGQIPDCPNCGGEVHVGIMSLAATCQGTPDNYCGWWWDDSVDGKCWNPPVEHPQVQDFTESEQRWLGAFWNYYFRALTKDAIEALNK